MSRWKQQMSTCVVFSLMMACGSSGAGVDAGGSMPEAAVDASNPEAGLPMARCTDGNAVE